VERRTVGDHFTAEKGRENMSSRLHRPLLCVLAVGVSAGLAAANDIVQWQFDERTTGQDVFWTSPDAIRTDAAAYDWYFELQTVEVWVSYLGLQFGPIDVTNDLPPEARQQSGFTPGPLPLLIIDEPVRYPDPPEPVTIAGDIRVELRADGFGEWSFTDITLGTATVDLGPPFGEQTVDLEEVRMAGSVDVDAFSKLGDLDLDDDVDQADLGILLAAYGLNDGGDLDGDGDTDQGDLGTLLGNFGYGT
jgi:hypothetical protein